MQDTQMTPDLQRRIDEFKQPAVDAGTQVLFWPTGYRDRSRQTTGIIERNNGRNCVIRVGATLHHAAPHVNDPRLTLNNDTREDGAWDFTTDYLQRQENARLVERATRCLEIIGKKVGLGTIDDMLRKDDQAEAAQEHERWLESLDEMDYQPLMKSARDDGVTFDKPQPKKAEIIAAWKKHREDRKTKD